MIKGVGFLKGIQKFFRMKTSKTFFSLFLYHEISTIKIVRRDINIETLARQKLATAVTGFT